ncbi:hypothetical protein NEUTE2DRAFT_69652, partial [Neurospora tetrasperma FGSC 2509]
KIHIYGLRNFGLEMQRRLLYRCRQMASCETRVVELDGGYRVLIALGRCRDRPEQSPPA